MEVAHVCTKVHFLSDAVSVRTTTDKVSGSLYTSAAGHSCSVHNGIILHVTIPGCYGVY